MDALDIPDSVASSRQNQLIFLSGLDVANSKSHAAVFSAFTLNREPDRVPLRFVLLDGTQTFGERKTKHSTASNSSRGFIKLEWLHKYVNEVPSVIVLFTDLGWDHPSWNEKVTECESKISSIRTSIGNRATRICLVLLQQNSTIDNPLATERASKLCQMCQLPTKQLFALPIGDRMFGSILRLEIAFHELAQAFYQQCLKSVRARSIPNNFPNLIIRQQFKLAFISELRQDTHTALRHYKLAYQHCAECEIIDSEIFELRSVAGLLNYKICQLSFLHSTALEAIGQQKRHSSIFFSLPPGSYPSPAIASIENILWKGKQCSLFANLFERAVLGGLVAVSTQHPGLYLQAAAYYYRQANEAIAVQKASPYLAGLSYPTPDPLTSATPTFYGQRPWRASAEGIDNYVDDETEKNACTALELSCHPNHERCIALLSSAMLQFKKYKCQRMQRYMMLLLSDEYCAMGQNVKALQLTSHILWECRREGFVQPIAAVLPRALLCAYRVADVKEFVALSAQMLNTRSFPCFASITEQIAANLNLIRSGYPPLVPVLGTNISQAEVEASQQLWKAAFAERVFFSINAPRLDAFVRVRVAFLTNGTEQIYASSPVFLMVALSSYSTIAVVFERMKIHINERNSNKTPEQAPLFEFTADNVEIMPSKETVKIYKLSIPHSSCTAAKELEVSALSLEMGSVHSCVYGTLDWDAQSLSYGTYDNSYARSILDACIGCTSVTIEPREAHFRLEAVEKRDALLGEVATIPLSLICEEDGPVDSIRLDWCLPAKEDTKEALFFINEENDFVTSDSKILKYNTPQSPPFKVQLNVRYCARTVCSVNMTFVVSIVVDGAPAQKHFSIPLHSRPPFEINCKILSINNEVIENPLAEISLFARADITSIADVVVAGISWRPGSEMEISEEERMLLKDEACCVEGDILSVCAPVRFTNTTKDQECHLGDICIRWRRRDSLSEAWVMSQFSAGNVNVKRLPFSIEARVPTSNFIVRTAIPILFTVRSLCSRVLDLQMTLEPSDMFMFAGNKKVAFVYQ